jgi:hypothetical protein
MLTASILRAVIALGAYFLGHSVYHEILLKAKAKSVQLHAMKALRWRGVQLILDLGTRWG